MLCNKNCTITVKGFWGKCLVQRRLLYTKNVSYRVKICDVHGVEILSYGTKQVWCSSSRQEGSCSTTVGKTTAMQSRNSMQILYGVGFNVINWGKGN